VQELLAGLGIGVAVALLFATLVANGSIASSTDQIVRAVIGPANLQLRARSDDGFPESTLKEVKDLPGVEQAAPLLERTAMIKRPDGRRTTVDIAGTDPALALLDGLAHTIPLTTFSQNGIGLSQTAANALGIPSSWRDGRHELAVSLRGARVRMRLSAILGPEAFGALSRASVAVMPLKALQQLTHLPDRITRILVVSQRGREALVRRELGRLSTDRLIVAPANQDEQLLRQTLAPSNQASTLFAAISVLLGFLFAFNAMLLTVPERRQIIANLRVDGTRRKAIVQIVLFQALCLGLGASLVGVLAGYGLSRSVFQQSPGYLSQAFTLGTGTIVDWMPVVVSIAGGLLAAILASLLPLLDLRTSRSLDAVYDEDGDPGNVLAATTQRWLVGLAFVLVAAASVLFALVPSAAIVSCVALALATVLFVPLTLALVLRAAHALAQHRPRMTLLPVALDLLQGTRLRSLALAATGSLALFGSIALGGARHDLLGGIARYTSHYVAGADVWVVNPDDNQAINDFASDTVSARIAVIRGVRSVRAFQGGFLDLGTRRVWVIAWPQSAPATLLQDQIVEGGSAFAAARLREAGWITVSQQLASRSAVSVGNTISIPTPSGERSYRIAATTTNFGWSPGAIVMSRGDYESAWESTAPTALGVGLDTGITPEREATIIARTLGPESGLEVLSARRRIAEINRSASEGLSQLGDITTLLLIAAVLALVAAVGSSIWQQRILLAARRMEGTKSDRLRKLLAIQVLLLLAAGCVSGALAGLYGVVVIDGYLVHVTGFPVIGGFLGRRPLETFVLVVLSVLLIATIPGWLASRVSPELALAED
jgi:putative ABC transport system permease protein